MGLLPFIRQARRDDIGRIAEIESQSLALWSETQFLEELGNPRSVFLVAEISGSVMGYIAARTVLDETEIFIIAAAAETRRRGIATALLDAMLDRLHHSSRAKIFLEVGGKNTAARAFYRNMGFHESGMRPDYYHNDDAILMVRDYEGNCR